MNEQKNQPTAAAVRVRPDGPHDGEPAIEWQAELRKVYEANAKVGKPPYAGIEIRTRGELSWIIRQYGGSDNYQSMQTGFRDLRATTITGDMSELDLSFVDFRGAIIAGARFGGAGLESANFSDAFIIDSSFAKANMDSVRFFGVRAVSTSFTGADLSLADVRNAVMVLCNFDRAILAGANMSSATFSGVDFRGANLSLSNLSGTILTGDFRGMNLTRARMDAATVLGSTDRGAPVDTDIRLGDVAWNGAILASIRWDDVPRLGDEADIRVASTRAQRVQAYGSVARAYYGLARALDAQGLTAPALRYRRRQHQLERAALVRDFKFGQWLFSGVLNLVSGYGDRPGRALRTYLAVIALFATAYFAITNAGIVNTTSQPLQWYEAIVLSLTSFHGRGFFPQFTLGDPVAIVAAVEAVVGLFIELVLIATFTQRFFAR